MDKDKKMMYHRIKIGSFCLTAPSSLPQELYQFFELANTKRYKYVEQNFPVNDFFIRPRRG